MSNSNHPKLSATMLWFSLGALVLSLLLVAMPLRGYVSDYESDVQTEIAERAGHALQLTISRAVGREWDSLNAVASQADLRSKDSMRSFTDAVIRASTAVAWVGIASSDGIILAGSNGLREGEDVGLSRWFRDGLTDGSVGDVFIPERSPVAGSESGLINMSAPVIDSFGTTQGVAVYSLKVDWLQKFVEDSANQLEVDVQIVDGDGRSVVEHVPFMGVRIPESVSTLTRTGQALTRLVDLEDGRRAILALQPEVLTGDLPFFDWDMIVRVPARTANESLSEFMNAMSRGVGLLFAVVGLLSIYFANYFLKPIGKLAADARAIADGEDIYPTENSSSRESASLSDALARLQSQLSSKAK